MKILSFSKRIEEETIQGLIDLLDTQIRELDVHLLVFDTFERFRETVKCKNERLLSDIQSGRFHGMFSMEGNVVFHFEFAYDQLTENEMDKKIFFVQSLYHEVRHKYQSVYMKDWYESEVKKYTMGVTGEEYAEQPIEFDADYFAATKINEHVEEISKMLKLEKNDWQLIVPERKKEIAA